MTTPARILIVDDDPIVAGSLAEFLTREGHETIRATSGEEALAQLQGRLHAGEPIAVVLTDVSMPGMDGMTLLRAIRSDHPEIAVIVLTGYGSIQSAVATLRLGACDYLTKPVVDQELRIAIERAIRQHALLSENSQLRRTLSPGDDLASTIVGTDPRMRTIFELLDAVAPSRTTVLMCGESGTGKSMIARAIHARSPRRDKPFVELACGSIPETLLESELFGHVKGAFTGAHADKVGRFLAADGGTIFLDEINSASPAMQLKLLRVLQERTFEPVGSNEPIEVDVRVILASNQPLEDLVADGRFRQDLYYRINVVSIELPPLRERIADIESLATFFLEEMAQELGKQLIGFSDEAMGALGTYRYPGNVRELRNIIERASVLCRRPTIQLDDLPPNVIAGENSGPDRASSTGPADDQGPWTPMPLAEALREPERQILLRALRANDWNRQQTADQLAINRTTLYKKMRTLGIDQQDDRLAG